MPFVSMKKVVCELGLSVPLISTHSTSKGLIGESGKRAGFLECYNVSQLLMDQLYKVASLGLCPNVDGQIMIDLMVKRPQPGDYSYTLYMKQIGYVRDSLKRRIKSLQQTMNGLPGVSCSEPEGSFYLYPQIRLPSAFIEEAKALGYKPDTFYCLRMLKSAGICTLPGNGFGQRPGTYHFRITCLPAEEIFPAFLARLSIFHQSLMQQYGA
jgi:alanine transaminase